MKSRVRESRTHGSVRGWHREVPVYSTADEFLELPSFFKFFKPYSSLQFLDLSNPRLNMVF